MTYLKRRLAQLEFRCGTQAHRPEVTCIFIRGVYSVDRETDEVTGARNAAAWVNVGASYDYLIRERGETEADFIERVDRMGSLGPFG